MDSDDYCIPSDPDVLFRATWPFPTKDGKPPLVIELELIPVRQSRERDIRIEIRGLKDPGRGRKATPNSKDLRDTLAHIQDLLTGMVSNQLENHGIGEFVRTYGDETPFLNFKDLDIDRHSLSLTFDPPFQLLGASKCSDDTLISFCHAVADQIDGCANGIQRDIDRQCYPEGREPKNFAIRAKESRSDGIRHSRGGDTKNAIRSGYPARTSG